MSRALNRPRRICAWMGLVAWPLLMGLDAARAQDLNNAPAQIEPAEATALPAEAQIGARTPVRRLELSTSAQHLTAGYGNWRDQRAVGTYEAGSHVWQGELAARHAFGQDGKYLAVGDTLTFSPDWYGNLTVGAGDGAFYLPRVRVDLTASRKWGSSRQLVTSLGGTYYKAPDGHIDHALSLGGTYYFKQPWIVEAGLRLNRSNPGGISTHQQFAALTYGHFRQDLGTVRYAYGGEGYQAIAANTTLVNFQSRQFSASWRHWVSPDWGWLVAAERYSNPYYVRSGLTLGLFHDFP